VKAAKVLANSLLVHANTLETLNLRDDGLTSKGVEALFTILSSTVFPWLRVLDISGNEITEESMSTLCETFLTHKTTPQLTHLHLDDNELGSDGVILLAKVVKHMTNLTHLSLNTCELTGKGGLAIAKAVSRLPSFQQLDMNGNQFTPNAIEEITKVLSSANKTLGGKVKYLLYIVRCV